MSIIFRNVLESAANNVGNDSTIVGFHIFIATNSQLYKTALYALVSN